MPIIQGIEDWHIEDLYYRAREDASEYSYEDFIALVKAQRQYGISMAAVHEGKAIGMAGMFSVLPGVTQVWFILSDDIKDHKLWFHKQCKRAINLWIKHYKAHRVQATVDANFTMGVKWAKSFGFEIEGTMRKFSAQEKDHYLMSLLPENN